MILLAAAILSSAAWAYLALTMEDFNVEAPIRTARYALIWSAIMLNGWCWSTFMLSVGMRSLDFTNRPLVYAQAAALPFFMLHQPVIIAIAFYVVQWQVGIPVKLPVVVISSFIVSLALYELVIRRIRPLRVLFGMK